MWGRKEIIGMPQPCTQHVKGGVSFGPHVCSKGVAVGEAAEPRGGGRARC